MHVRRVHVWRSGAGLAVKRFRNYVFALSNKLSVLLPHYLSGTWTLLALKVNITACTNTSDTQSIKHINACAEDPAY